MPAKINPEPVAPRLNYVLRVGKVHANAQSHTGKDGGDVSMEPVRVEPSGFLRTTLLTPAIASDGDTGVTTGPGKVNPVVGCLQGCGECCMQILCCCCFLAAT